MAKKHKNYRPQGRRKTKKTTGRWERVEVNVIYIDKEKTVNEEGETIVEMFGTCTCGKWRTSEKARTFKHIGDEAKIHAEQSEGKCQFRKVF